MADAVVEELNTIDRDALMSQLASDLPWVSGEMGYKKIAVIGERTGLESERLNLIVSGKRKMKWSEYLSILFVLWEDDKGREFVEKRDYFPDALKKAMSINCNDHGQMNENI